DVAFQRHAARTSPCRQTSMHEGAIIANRPRVLDRVLNALPSHAELGREANDLLASVAGPCLRELGCRGVVAVGVPKLSPPFGCFMPPLSLEVATHDLHVLLRHRPRST